MLAEAALEQLNLVIADKGFVRCRDYQGIQNVFESWMTEEAKAEIAAYVTIFVFK